MEKVVGSFQGTKDTKSTQDTKKTAKGKTYGRERKRWWRDSNDKEYKNENKTNENDRKIK